LDRFRLLSVNDEIDVCLFTREELFAAGTSDCWTTSFFLRGPRRLIMPDLSASVVSNILRVWIVCPAYNLFLAFSYDLVGLGEVSATCEMGVSPPWEIRL